MRLDFHIDWVGEGVTKLPSSFNNIEISYSQKYGVDLTIKCKHCGFEHTSNLYREDKQSIEKKTSNHESCPNCGQVSTYDESDYD